MLKVLMMGGRRCGKTSALASLFSQMIHGKTNDFLTVCNDTILEKKIDPVTHKEEVQDSLDNKQLELVHFIEKGGNNTFLVDAGPTRNYWKYDLRIQIPGTSKSTEVRFWDSAGEFFDAGGKHHQEVVDFVKDCDVFVVVVDTPYLMASSQSVSHAANVVDSIHTFLTNITNHGGGEKKQVIFVPIKCEKWFREKRINEVVEKVEIAYSATINHLIASNSTEINIIPILTAGDILFTELRDPYLLYNTVTKTKIKCAKVSDRKVVLKNGKFHAVQSFEVLNEDPEGVFTYLDNSGTEQKTSIPRPSAWYRLPTDKKPEYCPYNCEQLPLYIIRFMFNKMEEKALGGILGKLFGKIFGTITQDDMRHALFELTQKGLIKENVDGIKTIKGCFNS